MQKKKNPVYLGLSRHLLVLCLPLYAALPFIASRQLSSNFVPFVWVSSVALTATLVCLYTNAKPMMVMSVFCHQMVGAGAVST